MFKYDTVHGRFKGDVKTENGKLYINGKPIHVFGERDPSNIQWGSVGADYIVESTVSFSTPILLSLKADCNDANRVSSLPSTSENFSCGSSSP